MATYIALMNFTQKGIETIKEDRGRMATFQEQAAARGVEIKAFYLTLGQYDAVMIVEAPDAETMATLAIAAGAQGNFRSETLQAFGTDEYPALLDALP